MRKLIVLTIIGFIFNSASALTIPAAGSTENDSIECLKNISVYRQFVKQKSYEDALIAWRWAYLNCPKVSKNPYVDGPKLFKYLIKKAKDDKALKVALVDSLMTLYDRRINFFGQEGYVLGLKGADMLKLKPQAMDEAFTILQQSVQQQASKSKASALLAYFTAADKKRKANTLSKQEVLDIYAEVSAHIDYNISKGGKSQKYYVQALEKIEKLFTPLASCEELISLFDAKFAQTPEDVALLKRITKTLSKKECTDAPIYFSASAKLHELEPSAFSAAGMGKLSIKKKAFSEAVSYYKKAIEIAETEVEKASYYYSLSEAYLKSGSLQTARSNAYKALEIRKDWGKPFILIGEIYAAARGEKSCCKNEFEQKLVYSLAIDKFLKAKSVDPSFNDIANKKIAKYSVYLPTTDDAFFYSKEDRKITEGSAYQFGCWINESTKVRLK